MLCSAVCRQGDVSAIFDILFKQYLSENWEKNLIEYYMNTVWIISVLRIRYFYICDLQSRKQKIVHFAGITLEINLMTKAYIIGSIWNGGDNGFYKKENKMQEKSAVFLGAFY